MAFNSDVEDRGRDRRGLPAHASGTALQEARAGGPPAPLDGMYPDGHPEGSEYRALFFRYLGIAMKYRKLILLTCGGALALGVVFTYLSTKTYRAVSTVQIDRVAAKVVNVDNGQDGSAEARDDGRFYQTEYDLLKSRSLAERVVEDLDLANSPGFLNAGASPLWTRLQHLVFGSGDTTEEGLAERKAQAVRMVMDGLSVAPVPNSRLVKISFDSPSPAWAQKVSNGIAQNFISDNLDRRYAASTYARNFLKDRLEELKLKLEQSERELVAYAEKKQILTDDIKDSTAGADLGALNSALQSARIDRIRDEELWKQAKDSNGLSLLQILNDPSVQALRQQRASLVADYQNKLSVFKPNYPDMKRLQAQIREIDRETSGAAGVIKNALKAQYEASLQREKNLEQEVDQAKKNVLDLRGKSIQYNILMREVDTNRSLYNGLLQQYKDVGVAGAVGTNNISMVDMAGLPKIPFKPSLPLNLSIAFVLGLIVSAALITVLELLDDTFKSPEEIEEQLGLAVLGVVPRADVDVVREVRDTPRSAIAEAYQSFRTALQFSTDGGVPKSILVASARPGEGKSTTSLALAINLAQLGMRVLLIDADLRKPEAERIHGQADRPGLSNILTGSIEPEDGIIEDSKVPGLSVIGAGPLPPNPAELLAGPRMASLLSMASERFDAIIVDGPPVMGLADAPMLASITAATLLVVAVGETRRGVIRGNLRRLQFARARMLGAVLNKFDSRMAAYGYGYGYGYGYAYGYGELDYYGSSKSRTERVKPKLEAETPSEPLPGA